MSQTDVAAYGLMAARPNLFIASSSLDTIEFSRADLLVVAASSMVRPLIDKIIMNVHELTLPVIVERDKSGAVITIDHTILNAGYEPLAGDDVGEAPIHCTKFRQIKDASIDVFRIQQAIAMMNRGLLLTYLTFGSVYFRLVAQFDIVECRFVILPEFTDVRQARIGSTGMLPLKAAIERLIAETSASLSQFTTPTSIPLTAWICVYDNVPPSELGVRYVSHVERAAHVVVSLNTRMYMSEIGAARILLGGDSFLKDVHEVSTDPRSEIHLFGPAGALERNEERDAIRTVKMEGAPGAAGTVGALLRGEIGGAIRRLPRNTDITLQTGVTPLDDPQIIFDVLNRRLVNIFFPGVSTLIPRTALKDKNAAVSKDSTNASEQGSVVSLVSMLNTFLYKYETIAQRVLTDSFPFPDDDSHKPLRYTPEMYMVSVLNVVDRLRVAGGNMGIKSEIEIFRVQQNAQSQRDVATIQSESSNDGEKRKRVKLDDQAA